MSSFVMDDFLGYLQGVAQRFVRLPHYLFQPSMKKVRIPLVGAIFLRRQADTGLGSLITDHQDQRFDNVYFKTVTNPLVGAGLAFVAKRPGFLGASAQSNVAEHYTAGQIVDVTNAGSDGFVSVWRSSTADQVRVIPGNNGTSVTATVTGIAGASVPVTAVDSSAERSLFWCLSSSTANRKAFRYNVNANTLTEITDADLPKTKLVGNFAFMDGYAFVMTDSDGRIYNSDVNDFTAWTSTSFVSTQKQSGGRGVVQYRDKIVAFGIDYIEVYENVGNAGSPLQQIDHLRLSGYGLQGTDGATTAFGGTATRHLYKFADTVFWINNHNTGRMGVYRFNGFTPEKISTPDVDLTIGKSNTVYIAGVLQVAGYNFLCIHFLANQNILAYCLETNAWFRWTSVLFDNGEAITLLPSPAHAEELMNEYFLFAGTSLYELDVNQDSNAQYDDDGSAFSAVIQTRGLDLGTNRRKRGHRLTLIGADARETSTCAIQWSDDDGQTWSTARNVDLNDTRPTLTRLGIFRKRQFRITNSSDAPMELEAMELEYEELAA